MPVSAIILAAGSSSRMGQSKQLLPWKNETLLTHAIHTAMESRVGHVLIVLGSNESEHRKAIEKLPVTIVSNPLWKNGMGSSLKAGLKQAKDAEAVLIMVCDQPFVTTDHLNNLIQHFERTGQLIVASKYMDTVGVPALFSKKMFDELMDLDDKEGARKVIMKHDHSVVIFASGVDLDTPDDYQKALSH
jgi:molybdenum cofactor cytidylyltransferase